jgi:hypothetical protein
LADFERASNDPEVRTPKVEAHPTKWSVVLFHGAGLGVIGQYAKGCTLVGHYDTKAEADAEAAKVKGGFVLPPRNAWAGKH